MAFRAHSFFGDECGVHMWDGTCVSEKRARAVIYACNNINTYLSRGLLLLEMEGAHSLQHRRPKNATALIFFAYLMTA